TMRALLLIGLFMTLLPLCPARAQELFILTEPASTVPKGVVGIRAFGQAYEERGAYIRGLAALRVMYGVTPKLTVMVTASASNHHSKDLPPDFPDHNTPQIGVALPWRA